MDQRRAFEEMYADHAAAVRAFILRRHQREGSDDVASEVFLTAWRRVEELPGDPLPWLLNIARGALANRNRGDRRRQALRERLVADAGAGPTASGQELDLGLFDALATLSESDQELLLLAAWDGLSVAQIATVLAVPRGTAAVRLHRARRRLAWALDGKQRQRTASLEQRSNLEVF